MQTTLHLPPTTPTRPTYSSPSNYTQPLHSSPLASSPASSPSADAHARRRSYYKATPFSSPASRQSRVAYGQRPRSATNFVQGSSAEVTSTPTEEAPRKAFLRERLKARCLERATQKRERALQRGSRHVSSDRSSDGFEEMMEEDDEDEDEEIMLNDELFRRIVDSAKRKERHAYRLSYAYDVGSSFDPDLEDPQSWETELHAPNPLSTEPDDLLDEELEAYAAEAELNLDDLQVDDIFSFSDFEDGDPLQEDGMDTD